jgi:hypothetical protein
MGNYYRQRSQPYLPGQSEPFKISRSKIELFVQCQRCFWLDARLKIKRPSGPPFSLNNAVDELFKKEFDSYRKQSKAHPIMTENKIMAIPFDHPDIDTWRENFIGINTVHESTNLYVFGALDDVWITDDGQLIVVDYKATAKTSEVSLDAAWQDSYKRQVEVYQWLLRQNGFKVSNRAIFVYTNGRLDLDKFGDRLEFRTKIIDYQSSDSWIEPTLTKIKECLEGPIPRVGVAAMGGACDYCDYARKRTELTLESLSKK